MTNGARFGFAVFGSVTNGARFGFAAFESVTNGASFGVDPSGFGPKMSHFDLTAVDFVLNLHSFVPAETGSMTKQASFGNDSDGSKTNGAPFGDDSSGFGPKMSHSGLTAVDFVLNLHSFIPAETGPMTKQASFGNDSGQSIP
ncbi:MAG: hypothetical protein GY950_27995 [bacterium]|nr:hypothetical protein [bacterium]